MADTTPAAVSTSAVTSVESTVVTDVKAEVTKAESWLKKYAYQFIIGFIVGQAIAHFLHV